MPPPPKGEGGHKLGSSANTQVPKYEVYITPTLQSSFSNNVCAIYNGHKTNTNSGQAVYLVQMLTDLVRNSTKNSPGIQLQLTYIWLGQPESCI